MAKKVQGRKLKKENVDFNVETINNIRLEEKIDELQTDIKKVNQDMANLMKLLDPVPIITDDTKYNREIIENINFTQMITEIPKQTLTIKQLSNDNKNENKSPIQYDIINIEEQQKNKTTKYKKNQDEYKNNNITKNLTEIKENKNTYYVEEKNSFWDVLAMAWKMRKHLKK